MKCLLAAACTLLTTAGAFTQDAGDAIDLMTPEWRPAWRQLPLYVPKVPAQVTCIRSDAEATRFALAAWGEDKQELHVDFKNEQVVLAAWGAMRSDEGSLGSMTDILCERLLLTETTLKVRLHTVLWPGPGIDVPLDSEQAGRTLYPSLFLAAPRTERVEVDVVGSRRRDPERDVPTVGQKGFEVRIHPDSTPIREQIVVIQANDTVEQPRVTFDSRAGEHVLDIAWGKLGAGSYRLQLLDAAVANDVLRATVRAENVPIMLYSGPGEHHPRLTLLLPPVRAVQLHIVRAGGALPEGTPDFTAAQAKGLVVTVDATRTRPRTER